jgi:hypothetical protein
VFPNRIRSLITLCVGAALLSGCGSYTVMRCGDTAYLLPPRFVAPYIRVDVHDVAKARHFTTASRLFALHTEERDGVRPVSVVSIARAQLVEIEGGRLSNACGKVLTADADLRKDFEKFQRLLEQAEVDDNVVNGGAERIWRRVAEVIPAPLASTLFYTHALHADDVQMTVDLLPGMRVRLEREQFVMPPEVPEPKQQYVNVGASLFAIHDGITDGRQTRFVDAFTGSLRNLGLIAGSSAPPAGPEDLDLRMRRYLRLLYPIQLTPAQVKEVNLNDERVRFVSADSHCEFAPDPECDALVQKRPGDRGHGEDILKSRSFPVPEVAITVNGELRYVPLGTTLGNVASDSVNWSVTEFARHVRFRRRAGTRLIPVRFRTADPHALDLTLVTGDELTW